MKSRLLSAVCACAIALCSTADAASIPIVNSSFEELAPGVVLGVRNWTCSPCFQAGGTVTSDPIVGWTITGTGDAGTFRPSANEYPGGGGLTNPATGIPDGVNVAFSNGPEISQVLSEKLTAGLPYSLSVDIGNRNDIPLPDFTIALLAGGNLLTSVDSTSITSLPADGTFSTVTLSYLAASDNPFLGQTLEIQLINNGGAQMNYDKVSLSTIPLPASVYLFGSGILGLIGIVKRKKAT